MKSQLVLFSTACFLISCTTTAKRKTAPYVPVPVTAAKKPKSISGMATKKIPSPPPQPEPVVVAPVAPQTSDALEYLKALVNKSIQAPRKEEQDVNRLHAIDIVETKLNEEQLENVADDSDFGYLRAHAMYRLGEIALENKETSRAKKYYSSVIEFMPGSDLATRSQEIIFHIDASKNVQAQTIGAILPLTGKNAPIGQRALRGLEMGLGLHIPGSAFKLAVMDSEGNPDSARRSVERLVTEDNVIAVVGSLLSKTGPAVASKANELNVPSISLSQRTGLTEIGPTVFRNSLTTGMQIRALVRTAMNSGVKKFAVLYPNDSYGVEFTNIFWDEVLARGGKITAVQTYSPKETDFRLVIQRLVGTYYGEARQDEFNQRMKELQSADHKKSVRQSNLESVLNPVTDFEAIFIPDSIKAMGQIAAMLSYNDVKNVKLLGTNIWNNKDLARRAGTFANDILFVDSIAPAALEKSNFITEYKNIYKEQPSLIEIQAYDAGLILRQLIASGSNTREELTESLTQLKNFPGSLGTLNINSDREIERPVIPLTIEKGEIVPYSVQR